jgi:hemolysin activation/secretion protein
MPVRPVTFAARALHVARYGATSEDTRLTPLFIGYSTLVRGYDVNTFRADECSLTLDGSCPEYDRLFGSRILVFNGEARAPIPGLWKGRLDYGPIPVEIFGFFDAGIAWTQVERPQFVGNGAREWVTSVGAGARVNLFGFAIAEFNLARPIQRPERGFMFVFNFRPGF